MALTDDEKNETALARSFWNASAQWRTVYFDNLVLTNPESLSFALRAERQFVIGESEFINRSIGEAVNVLEIGCGVGRTLLPLAAQYPSRHFLGLDYAEEQLGLYREQSQMHPTGNALCVLCDVSRIPLIAGWSDLTLIVNQTLGNLNGRHRQAYLHEVSRVTRPLGQLYVGCFTNIELAAECYAEWGVPVRTIDRASHLAQLESYSSLWAPESHIVEELRTVEFAPVKIEYTTLGFFGLFQKYG